MPEPLDDCNVVSLECPQQDNCNDCGIFLLIFMHLMCLNEGIILMEQSGVHFMRKVALSLTKLLSYPQLCILYNLNFVEVADFVKSEMLKIGVLH